MKDSKKTGDFFAEKRHYFYWKEYFSFKNISNIMKFYYFIDFVFGSLYCMKLHIF